MDIDQIKKVVVVGWGKSGISLARLLAKLGKKVYVTEEKENKNFSFEKIDYFRRQGIEFEFGGHSLSFFKGADLVILSPAVDVNKSLAVKIAQELAIPYLGEIEFAFSLTKAKCIAITGTNGKTTTTFLTYRLLRNKYRRVFLGGNIGIAFSSFVLRTKPSDLIVLEVSSFQLETINKFKPYIASFLNIEPDHLDRHPSFEDYLKAKERIFSNQDRNDWAVLNSNSLVCQNVAEKITAKTRWFSNEFANENFSCVGVIGDILGISKEESFSLFSSFQGLAHRMQVIDKIEGVTFINDSKATNVNSTIWALKNLNAPIILLAGGKDKGFDYTEVIPYLTNVKKINLFGQASEKIEQQLKNSKEIQKCSSLEESMSLALENAQEGDFILLSPMCASFDMFTNYKERGKTFKCIVKKLKESYVRR